MFADIDECQQDTSPCSGSNVRCINRPGSYICQCSDGYAMDQLRKRCEGMFMFQVATYQIKLNLYKVMSRREQNTTIWHVR